MPTGPTLPISPYTADLEQIQRRRALAQALQAQSMEPIQGGSVGGVPAPISPFQGIAKIVQAYKGKKLGEKATEEQKALGQKYQTDYRTAVAGAIRKLQSGDAMGAIADLSTHPQGQAFIPMAMQELQRQRMIQALRGGSGGAQPAEAALAGGGGPTLENAQKLEQMQQMPQSQLGGPVGGVPMEAWLTADPTGASYLSQMAQGNQVTGSPQFTGGAQPKGYAMTKGGGVQYLPPEITPRDKLERIDYGGAMQWENPYTGAPIGQLTPKTFTPEQQVTVPLQQRKQALDEERLYFETGRRLPQPKAQGLPPSGMPPQGAAPLPGPMPSPQPVAPAPRPAPKQTTMFDPNAQPQIQPLASEGAVGTQPLAGGTYAGVPTVVGKEQGYATGGAGMTPKGKAELAAKRAEEQPKQLQLVQHAKTVSGNAVAKVEDALTMVDKFSSGAIGWAMRKVPGTDAYDLQQKVDTIKANLGFQELQQMRNMSPTGGALGQVAIQELEMLQKTVASLETAQSPAQLKQHLEDIRKHFQTWVNLVERSYVNVYGPLPAEPQQPKGGKSSVDDLLRKYGPTR